MDNPLAHFPGYLLRRAAAARMAELSRRLEPHGLSVTEASILALIAHNPDISQAECGRLLGIGRGNLNPLVRRLIACGLIEVKARKGRAQGLTASPAGETTAAAVVALFQTHEAATIARVPVHLREDLLDVLRALWSPEDDDVGEDAVT